MRDCAESTGRIGKIYNHPHRLRGDDLHTRRDAAKCFQIRGKRFRAYPRAGCRRQRRQRVRDIVTSGHGQGRAKNSCGRVDGEMETGLIFVHLGRAPIRGNIIAIPVYPAPSFSDAPNRHVR